MLRAATALVLALLTLSACAGEVVAPPLVVAVEGSYTLRTIDGAPLPYAIHDASGAATGIEVTAGSLTLDPAGTLSVLSTFRTTTGTRTTTVPCSGTWRRAGDVLTIDLAGAGQCADLSVSGTFSGGNTLTIAWAPSGAGQVSVYRR